MSLRKDSFERILAFSKMEEASHLDMETTRWLWMLASLGFDQVLQTFSFPGTWRNSWTPARGMGLNSQERNLRNSNWSRRRSQSSASPIGKILVYQNHYLTNLIKFSPKVMPSWRHIPYLGEERRTCRSAPGSCVHFWTTCFWGVESNRTLEGYEICQVFLSIEPLHYPNWKKGKWFAVNDKQKLKQSMDQQLPLVASNFPFQCMEMGIPQWGEGQLNRNSLFLKLSRWPQSTPTTIR